MKDPCKNEPYRQVRKLLEDYREPYQQNDWEAFVHLKRNRKRKRRLLHWTGVAAGVLIVLAGLLAYAPGHIEFFAASHTSSGADSSADALPKLAQKENLPASSRTSDKSGGSSLPGVPTNPSTRSRESALITKQLLQNGRRALTATGTNIPQSLLKDIFSSQTAKGNSGLPLTQTPDRRSTAWENTNSLLPLAHRKLAPTTYRQPLPPMTQLPAIGSAEIATVPRPENRNGKRQRWQQLARTLQWGLALTPLVPHVAGSNASVQLGAGVLAEISLSRKVHVSFGVLFNRQQFEIEAFPRSPALTGRQLTATRVGLRFFDLPVSLKYNFLTHRRACYSLSMGLSSLAYLEQAYQYDYERQQKVVSYIELLNGAVQEVVTTEVSREREQYTHAPPVGSSWSQMFNAAFSVEKPLGKSAVITVEPFLKYGLSSLKRENIRFGYSGVNLRIGWRHQLKKD